MTDTSVMQIALQAIEITIKLCAPILVVTLVIGLFISLLQSATQVQEVTLTFVPKLVGVALVIVLAGNWMLGQMIGFTHGLFSLLPQLTS
ncbi:MAG: flagellar biosynthesis protein FliQ [Acidimicrobiia bacterium]